MIPQHYKGYEICIFTLPMRSERKYSGSFSILSPRGRRPVYQEPYGNTHLIHSSEIALKELLMIQAKEFIDDLS